MTSRVQDFISLFWVFIQKKTFSNAEKQVLYITICILFPHPQVILSEPSPSGETPFFETWLQTCMPEEGKTLNPDHPCFRPEPGKVESLVTLLNNSSEMKLV